MNEYLATSLEPIQHLLNDLNITKIQAISIDSGISTIWCYRNNQWSQAKDKRGKGFMLSESYIRSTVLALASTSNLKALPGIPVFDCVIPKTELDCTMILKEAGIQNSAFIISKVN